MDLLDTLSRFWPHLASGFHVLAALLASIHALPLSLPSVFSPTQRRV